MRSTVPASPDAAPWKGETVGGRGAEPVGNVLPTAARAVGPATHTMHAASPVCGKRGKTCRYNRKQHCAGNSSYLLYYFARVHTHRWTDRVGWGRWGAREGLWRR